MSTIWKYRLTTRTQEDRDLVALDLMDKTGLVHEIVLVAYNFPIIGYRVWNAPVHAGQYAAQASQTQTESATVWPVPGRLLISHDVPDLITGE